MAFSHPNMHRFLTREPQNLKSPGAVEEEFHDFQLRMMGNTLLKA